MVDYHQPWTPLFAHPAYPHLTLQIDTSSEIRQNYGKHSHGQKYELKGFPAVTVNLKSASGDAAQHVNWPPNLKVALRVQKGATQFSTASDILHQWANTSTQIFRGPIVFNKFLTNEVSGKGCNKTHFFVEVAVFTELPESSQRELVFLSTSRGFVVNARERSGVDTSNKVSKKRAASAIASDGSTATLDDGLLNLLSGDLDMKWESHDHSVPVASLVSPSSNASLGVADAMVPAEEPLSSIIISVHPKTGHEGCEILVVGNADFPEEICCMFGLLVIQCQEVIPGQRRVLRIPNAPPYAVVQPSDDTYPERCVPITIYSSRLSGGSTSSDLFTYLPSTTSSSKRRRSETRDRTDSDDDDFDDDMDGRRDENKRLKLLSSVEQLLNDSQLLFQSNEQLLQLCGSDFLDVQSFDGQHLKKNLIYRIQLILRHHLTRCSHVSHHCIQFLKRQEELTLTGEHAVDHRSLSLIAEACGLQHVAALLQQFPQLIDLQEHLLQDVTNSALMNVDSAMEKARLDDQETSVVSAATHATPPTVPLEMDVLSTSLPRIHITNSSSSYMTPATVQVRAGRGRQVNEQHMRRWSTSMADPTSLFSAPLPAPLPMPKTLTRAACSGEAGVYEEGVLKPSQFGATVNTVSRSHTLRSAPSRLATRAHRMSMQVDLLSNMRDQAHPHSDNSLTLSTSAQQKEEMQQQQQQMFIDDTSDEDQDCEALTQLGKALGLSDDVVRKMISRTGFPKEITLLPLSNNNLRSLPRDLVRFPDVETLLLDNNKLSCVDYVHTLTNLRMLWLQENQLVAIPPSLGSLRQLTTLLLHHNKLTDLPRELGQLVCLEVLALDHNELTRIPVGALSKNLSKLMLNHNLLTELPSDFGELTKLKTLFVHNNLLNSLPPNLGKLKRLSSLSLADNKFMVFPVELCQMANLKELSLENNLLLSVHPSLAEMTQLQTLSLRKNKLHAIPANSVGGLTNLEHFDAGHNRLHHLTSDICRLPKLRVLILDSNQLSTLPPYLRLLARRTLRVLDLNDNPLFEADEDFAPRHTPSLFALCALKLWEQYAHEPVPPGLDATMLSYLASPHQCFICGQRYFESPATLISFVQLRGTRVPLNYELCSRRCVETVQRGFVKTDNWQFT